jgi:aspartate ammonia-lyase
VLSLALIAFTAFKRNRKKSYSDTIKTEEKRIYNMIDSAKKLTNEKNQFYDIIEKSIIKSLMVKFSIRMESLNKEKIQEITQNRGLSNEHISQIINLIENCEKAKYSRSSDSVMNKDLENAKKVVGIIMKNKS